MTREESIQRVVSSLSKLSNKGIEEVTNFAEFLLQKQEDTEIQKQIYRTVEESEAFDFLHDEEEI